MVCESSTGVSTKALSDTTTSSLLRNLLCWCEGLQDNRQDFARMVDEIFVIIDHNTHIFQDQKLPIASRGHDAQDAVNIIVLVLIVDFCCIHGCYTLGETSLYVFILGFDNNHY